MNVVCLTGRLAEASDVEVRLQPGWSSVLLEVPRHAPGDGEDVGVFTVTLVLPPRLEERPEPGALVAVVGMLHIDTDYSGSTAQAHHSVIAESIEPLPLPPASA